MTGNPNQGTYRLAVQQNSDTVTRYSDPISPNASAEEVQAALEVQQFLKGDVKVAGPNGGPYDIEFINDSAGVNFLPIWSVDDNEDAGNNLRGGSNPHVGISIKRLGLDEASIGHGDSGSPIFIGDKIVGVTAALGRRGGQPPLIGKAQAAFGTSQGFTRVASYDQPENNIDNVTYNFIPSTISAATPYNLVLDMNYQLLGQAQGLNGKPFPKDPITITASRGGLGDSDLILRVNDAANPSLSGIYFQGRADTISSLTIRGGAENDTITLFGNNLGVGKIAIDGRGGDNTIVIGANDDGSLDDFTSDTTIDGGAGGNNSLIVNDVGTFTDHTIRLLSNSIYRIRGASIDCSHIKNLTFNAGNGHNTINILSAAPDTITTINAGWLSSIINIGSTNDVKGTVNQISGPIFINGPGIVFSGVSLTVNVNDQGSVANTRTYKVSKFRLDVLEKVDPRFFVFVGYERISALNINGAPMATWDIRGTPPDATTSTNSGPRGSLIKVSSALDNTGKLDDLAGALEINGGSGQDTAILNDQGSSTIRTFTVTDTTVTANDLPTITYASIESLNLTPSSQVLDSLVVDSGRVNILGTATVDDATVNGGVLVASGLTVSGALAQNGGNTLVTNRLPNASGLLNLTGGDATFGSLSSLILQDGQVHSNHALQFPEGVGLVALGSSTIAAGVVSNGVITLGGGLSLPNFMQSVSPGTLTITGDFRQTLGGTLIVNLGGGYAPQGGTDYSQAIVGGAGDTIFLSGHLNLNYTQNE